MSIYYVCIHKKLCIFHVYTKEVKIICISFTSTKILKLKGGKVAQHFKKFESHRGDRLFVKSNLL